MARRHGTRLVLLAVLVLLGAGRVAATTVIPIADTELYDRADVIVHGVVVANEVEEDPAGAALDGQRDRAARNLEGGDSWAISCCASSAESCPTADS